MKQSKTQLIDYKWFRWSGGFLTLLFWLTMSFLGYSQQTVSVSGIVSDRSGEPLQGVNVVIKQSKVGVATNPNGKYTVNAEKNDVLVFSYLGYSTQEIPVGNKTIIDVVLTEDTQLLDEVVVVGYGAQKKANLTGAVAQIGSERLENRSVPTLTQALQGTVANLNISTSNGAPGTKQDINIRGYTGINIDDSGNKSNVSGSPLVVIDGVQGGDLSTINTNDIASISILKDAASAAIYGSSAPFGVIIVTTKKGRTGKAMINYNNNFGFSQAINLPHYVNSLDFANAFNEVGFNSNYTAKLFDDDVIQRIKDYQAGKITDETMKHPSQDNWLAWNSANANNDWFDIYFKNSAFSQQHNIGISGGTEVSNYYVGMGYNQQDGLYNWANDTYKRYNVRANLSTDLTKWLTFGFRGAFARTNTDVPAIYSNISGGSSYSYDYFHQMGRTYPTVPLKNPDGGYSEGSGVLNFIDGGRRTETTDNAILTGEFQLHFLPGWDATLNYSYDGTYRENRNHRKTFYLLKPSGAKEPRGGTSPNYIERNMYKNQHHTINAFTSYEKTIGKNSFKVLAGFTQELYDNLSMSGGNDQLYSDEVPMLSMTYGTNRSLSDAASQLAIRGGFGRINYNYDEKYLLELNGRYDGTSRFLKDVRYKFYPGVSAAWVISKESFWEPVQNYVNYFKFRGSYASLGDQSFASSYYPFYPSLGNNSPTGGSNRWVFSGGRESIFWQPGLVNYDLTWITTNTLGFGADFAFLDSRLNASFDWYSRRSKDFASFGEKLPAVLGTTAPRVNDAETETKGFELTVGWKDKVGEVSYGANLVLSDYVGKVLKYNNPTKLISDVWYDGMTMGEIWGYETVGLFKDQAEIDGTDQSNLSANWYPGDVHYKDLNGDGKINNGDNTIANPGDRKVIGNTTPRYSFGLNLNAEYKNFDLTVFLQGVGKRDMMFATNANYFWGFTGGEWQSSYFTVHTDRWTQENPNGYFPRAYFNTTKNLQAQTRYLQDASYLRVKNLQLGYTIPKELTGKISIQKARIFTNIENLATFTNLMEIIDPEIVNSNAKVYPLKRTFAFGINVTF
ncbi:SusC/RagA family TonB-linked outer membrane protein [Bacteroidia bacterium]|nr:SusC/RagA family TonB-linked outer membrane protein [Bacteroidia bacterium]